MGWRRKAWDRKKITVFMKNRFIRICKNCGVEQHPGAKSKKCWKCGKLVDTKVVR